MPNKKQFKTHEEYLQYYREYRRKKISKCRTYNRKYMRIWRKKNGCKKEKYDFRDLIRLKVFNAIKEGILIKKPCCICGKKRVQAHHNNYNKPLEVVWLCPSHHKILHLSTR